MHIKRENRQRGNQGSENRKRETRALLSVGNVGVVAVSGGCHTSVMAACTPICLYDGMTLYGNMPAW